MSSGEAPVRSVRFVATGRVQGVFFRAYTMDQARRCSLSGWVLNRSDAAVEGVAQGERDAVSNFLEAVRRGSPASRVDDLCVEDVERDYKLQSFEVR